MNLIFIVDCCFSGLCLEPSSDRDQNELDALTRTKFREKCCENFAANSFNIILWREKQDMSDYERKR